MVIKTLAIRGRNWQNCMQYKSMRLLEKVKTSSAQVVVGLRQAIVSGRLEPGTRLREAELSKELGVSRSPVREALRVLEAEGLVKLTPNKGAFVTQLSQKDLKEIYELRVLLEVHAIRVACKKMTHKNLEEMKVILDEMEKRLQNRDYLGYLMVSHEFHEYYIQKCKNERLYNLFKIIWNNTLAAHTLAYSYPKRGKNSLEEHRRIYNALMQRNPGRAEAFIREHLKSSYERARKYLGGIME